MPMMCEECKCSNWYCAECGESNHNDCSCSCCGCKCQKPDENSWCNDCGQSIPYTELEDYESYCEECGRTTQPTNQTGEQAMTMINPEPIKLTPSETQVQFTIDEVERIKADRDAALERKDIYVEKYNKAHANIGRIFNAINDDIRELKLTPEDSFPLDTLSEIFESVGLELNFKRDYQVEMEYTIKAVFTIEADSAEDATQQAEDGGIYSIDFDTFSPDEWEVSHSTSISTEEA